MKEEWLDKLRTRLHRECGEEAPRGLLDDIRKEMERRGAVPARPVRQKATTVPMWILRTASAAAVVAVPLAAADCKNGRRQDDGHTGAPHGTSGC